MVHIWTIILVDSLKAPQHVGHVAPQSVPEQNAIHDPPGPWDGGTVGCCFGLGANYENNMENMPLTHPCSK